MRALLEHAGSEQYRALFGLMLTGGLRIGEALGLIAADLDQESAVVRVECQLGRDGIRMPLKTPESRRAIDLPQKVIQQLSKLVTDRSARVEPDAYLFASRTGGGLERKVARAALKRASTAAKLAQPHPTLHDLRHTHASMLIALSVSVVDVQRRLGHRKPDTTLRVYAHEWKYGEMQRSRIGRQIAGLFDDERPTGNW
ncbi:MAG TPA: site-specific integrase [Gaiellaceae bacterium]